MKIKIGDKVVIKNDPQGLHCSHWVYPYAIVKSLQPLVLVSEEKDMTWNRIKLNEVKVI